MVALFQILPPILAAGTTRVFVYLADYYWEQLLFCQDCQFHVRVALFDSNNKSLHRILRPLGLIILNGSLSLMIYLALHNISISNDQISNG